MFTVHHRNRCCLIRVLLIAVLLLPGYAYADTIAIIGTDAVASALGPRFAGMGHTVVYGSRHPASDSTRALVARTGSNASAASQARAAEQADIVVLAFGWEYAEAVFDNLGDLTGKILIDPINPYVQTDDNLAVRTVETSAAEIMQGWAPGAHLVKALNTVSSVVMTNPERAHGPVSVPVVGNNLAAKQKVMELVEALGLQAVDLGPLAYAHEVEGMLILSMNAKFAGHRFAYHLRPVDY